MEPSTKKAVKKTVSLPHDKLMSALYFIMDLFSRPNIPFFLLDETAKCAKENKDMTGEQITVGVRKLDAQPNAISMMDSVCPHESMDDKHITYTYDGVPIVVKIIDSSDTMFSSLNTFMYGYEFFSLPNPFDKYWEKRSQYV